MEFSSDDGLLMDSHSVHVGERTVSTEDSGKKGTVNSTSSYKLTGNFTLEENQEDVIVLTFGADYEASTALPGLYVYLSNNPNTTNGAYEIQEVEVFSGAHSYVIPNIGIEEYQYVLYFCKPFNVKVGHGQIEDQ